MLAEDHSARTTAASLTNPMSWRWLFVTSLWWLILLLVGSIVLIIMI